MNYSSSNRHSTFVKTELKNWKTYEEKKHFIINVILMNYKNTHNGSGEEVYFIYDCRYVYEFANDYLTQYFIWLCIVWVRRGLLYSRTVLPVEKSGKIVFPKKPIQPCLAVLRHFYQLENPEILGIHPSYAANSGLFA